MFREWCRHRTYEGKRWLPFAKGGEYAPYYSDLHLVVNWERDGQEIEAYVLARYPYLKGKANWILHKECDYFRSHCWPVADKPSLFETGGGSFKKAAKT